MAPTFLLIHTFPFFTYPKSFSFFSYKVYFQEGCSIAAHCNVPSSDKLPVLPPNYSLHPITADICQGQRWLIVAWYQGMWANKVKNYQHECSKVKMRLRLTMRRVKGKRSHLKQWKLKAITFLFSSLIICTRPTSILAGPARPLHLPITWYPREAEEPAKPPCSPSSCLPFGTSQLSVEGVFTVRNRRTEAKIGSGQS